MFSRKTTAGDICTRIVSIAPRACLSKKPRASCATSTSAAW